MDSQSGPNGQPNQDSHNKRTGHEAAETTSGAIQKDPGKQSCHDNFRQDRQNKANIRDVRFSTLPFNRMDGIEGKTIQIHHLTITMDIQKTPCQQKDGNHFQECKDNLMWLMKTKTLEELRNIQKHRCILKISRIVSTSLTAPSSKLSSQHDWTISK